MATSKCAARAWTDGGATEVCEKTVSGGDAMKSFAPTRNGSKQARLLFFFWVVFEAYLRRTRKGRQITKKKKKSTSSSKSLMDVQGWHPECRMGRSLVKYVLCLLVRVPAHARVQPSSTERKVCRSDLCCITASQPGITQQDGRGVRAQRACK